MKRKVQGIIFILLSLALPALVAACQSPTAAPPTVVLDPTPTAAPTTTIEPSPDVEQARDAIVSALLSLNTLPNRLDSITALEDGTSHETAIVFVPPDRKSIVADGTEIIVVGDKVYMKPAGASEWQESQIPAATYLGEPVTEQSIRATLGEVVYLGTDQVDGRPVDLYRYTSTTKSGEIELHGETQLWVGQADGLPYKMVADGETLAVSTDPATGESKVQAVQAQTTSVIVFDPSLQVVAPLP